MELENYLERTIGEKLTSGQEKRPPSGKLSASKLWWPIQWQILATQFDLESHFDDYTLRKFQRGHDCEAWFIGMIEPKETQVFLEYRNAIGYCDAIIDTKDWDNPVGVIPLEVKSATNMKYKWIVKRAEADAGHIIQNAFYALAYGATHHAITYVASDDYRTHTTIYKTKDSKATIDKIIDAFEEAVKMKTIPVFEPREDWQGNIKYNNFPKFAGMNKTELKVAYKELLTNKK